MAAARRHPHLLGALALFLYGCGGGDGSSPPPPPDNSPATITLTPTGTASLVSGTTLTVTANVLTRDGRPVTGASINWVSSNPQVASVNGGVVTGVLVGTASITAQVGAVTSAPLAVTTTPGPAVALGLRTQPAGAVVGSRLSTQPAVEVRDAAGNTVTTSTPLVTVAIGSGGGTLVGTTSVTAVAGLAAFPDLGVTGLVGPRVLTFTAPSLAPVSSASFVLGAGPPVGLAIARAPIAGAIGTPLLVQPVIEFRDAAGNVSPNVTAPVTAAMVGGAGTLGGGLTVTSVAGVATFQSLAITGPAGNYSIAFSTPGFSLVNAPPVTLSTIVFGFGGERVQIMDVGASNTVGLSSATAPAFATRSASRVTIDNAGRFTARAEGQTFLVAANSLGADSVLSIVTRSPGGPVVRTSLGSYSLRSGDTTVMNLVLDPRTSAVGAVTVIVNLNTQDFKPVWQMSSLTAGGVQIAAAETNPAVVRFSIVGSTPITGPIAFGRLLLVNGTPGTRLMLTLAVIDAVAPDGSDLMSRITSTYYPLAFR